VGGAVDPSGRAVDGWCMRARPFLLAAAAMLILSGAFLPLSGCEDHAVHIGKARDPRPRTTDLEQGVGAPVEEGRRVAIHYRGFLADGTQILSTYEDGSPHEFTLGDGTVIVGMDKAVRGMRVGGKRRAVIPPELHWGRAGYADVVPRNARLTFEIELVRAR
jgi:peptidylprolyl isomerase